MSNDVMDELARMGEKKSFNNGVFDTSSENQFFTMIYNAFIRNTDYSMYQKLIFICLKSHRGDNAFRCFPGTDLIAKELNISVRKVKTVLQELEALGGILIIKRKMESNRDTSNLYILADIDMNTGNFLSHTLDEYRYLKKTIIKVKGK